MQRLVEANARRALALKAYSATRNYKLEYQGVTGSRSADMKVAASFVAPDQKDFKILADGGSQFLLNRVLYKLLTAEKSAIREDAGRSFDITPENYDFNYVGAEHLPTGDAYILEVKPRTSNKYLYVGRIWVDAGDYAVTRIQASPAKSGSFWIKSTDMLLSYGKFGDFWLPLKNESASHLRLGGQAVLTIDYPDYHINDPQLASGARPSSRGQPAAIPPASGVASDPH